MQYISAYAGKTRESPEMTNTFAAASVCLAQEIPTIFAAIRPHLCKMAHGYRVPNVDNYVDEWQANAFFIAKKFDNGELDKKALEGEGVESSDQEIDFLRLFKFYLKASFKNDLNKHYGVMQRTKYSEDVFAPKSDDKESSGASAFLVDTSNATANIGDSANISDLLQIVVHDLDRAKKTAKVASDRVNIVFYESLQKSLINLGKFWLSEPVVEDVDSAESKTYFDPDFREMLTPRILFYMAEAALKESSPLVASKIADICLSHAGMAMQRRLYRYFFDYQGGLSKRIIRFRNAKRSK